MTDIEQLVRESLQSAPMPETTVTDPVSAVTRRAAQARALIAASVVAVAVVVTAAVVVPMHSTGHNDHGRINTTVPPSPQPTTSAGRAPTSWPAQGSEALAAGGGSLWDLRPDPSSQSGRMYVDRRHPVTHARTGRWSVQAPATWLFYGLGRLWVTGGGDGAYPDGSLQVVDPSTGSVHALTSVRQQLSGVGFAAGHAWVLAGRTVWEVDTAGNHVATVTLPVTASQLGIVGTESGQLWVQAPKSWVRIDPASARVVDRVQFDGPMLGAAGGAAVWTYTAHRLVALTPSLLRQGESVAEGSRISVPGPVSEVARSTENGLFVVASDGPDAASESRLYYLNERQLTGTAAINQQTPAVPGGGVHLAPDGAGGVNYLTGDGAMHWSP